MTEKKSEFERRREAFEKSFEADNWNEAIKLGDALRQDFLEQFQDIPRLIERLASAYRNRGTTNRRAGDLDVAIADYDKAIEIRPGFIEAHSNKAQTIGLQAAKETEERLKQSYEEQLARIDSEREERLASVSEPKEIEERFSKRKKQAFDRLRSLRSSSDRLSCIIIFTLPLTWALLAYFLFFYCASDCKAFVDTTSFWSLPRAFTSLTLATLFLHLQLFLRIAHLNRNARIERHVLEDYERKSVMMLLANLKGRNVSAVLRHYKDKGTPEVLNRLYHPKYAYPHRNNAKDEGD